MHPHNHALQDDCIFCRIIRGESPAEVLYENDRIISILDIRPIHYGHALVIPKAHCSDLLSLPDDSLQDIMYGVRIVARALVEALDLEGFNVFANNGAIAGQSVFHFHMHVTPRYADDNIRFVLRLKNYADDTLRDMGERIRRGIIT